MKLHLGRDSLDFVEVPPGDFMMGSDNSNYSEAPCHRVTFARGFYIGSTPITQSQWIDVMGDLPCRFGYSPMLPVDNISWNQSAEFCRRAFDRFGLALRLPTESEWEYACRAGTTSDFFFSSAGPFGDDVEVVREVRQQLLDYAWFDWNSGDETHRVGLKLANPWGLYDIVGNVWEWCADVWHSDYDHAPDDGGPSMDNAEAQPRRCLRGGAWDMNAFRCRSSYRSFDHRCVATDRFGFRVAMSL